MEVSCYGLSRVEVQRRSAPEQILEEMIWTDDIDEYAAYLPDAIAWSYSARQHVETADALEALETGGESSEPFKAVCRVISTRETVDELGLSVVEDSTCFLSIKAENVPNFSRRFQEFRRSGAYGTLSDASKAWVDQWSAALDFVASRNGCLIGDMG